MILATTYTPKLQLRRMHGDTDDDERRQSVLSTNGGTSLKVSFKAS